MAPHSTSPTLPAESFTPLPDTSLPNGANSLDRQDTRTDLKPGAPSIPIAIVGMACRFSGDVTSPSKLWDLCAAGKDGWSSIPESRFDVKSLYHADQAKAGRVSLPGFCLSSDPARGEDHPGEGEERLDPRNC